MIVGTDQGAPRYLAILILVPSSVRQNGSHATPFAIGFETAKRFLIDQEEIARLLHNSRSATLGTVDERSRPHLVPIVFAYHDGRLYTAVDRKPKSTYRLKRLRNIEANSNVSVLVDHYDDDWTRLWWIRIDGTAQVIESGPRFDRGLALLAAKYELYAAQPPPGPVIEVQIEKMRAWSAS